MLNENQHPNNRSIMISVLGAPNVGKSTMINHLLGMDLSAVSSKPQTTRNRYNCIFTIDLTEVVLIDTPGVHVSNKEFNKRMNQQAFDCTDGADLNLLLIDLNRSIMGQFQNFTENYPQELCRTWVVFTKSDRIENADQLPLDDAITQAKELLPAIEKHFVISSKEGHNIHQLTGAICDVAQPGPHLYPRGEVSNKNERFFVTEYIREQAFLLLKEELPYEVAVVIDEYQDFRDKEASKITCHISATILVNRASQRAIVVGAKGSMIKDIGVGARKRIEEMVGGQVHLNLHVKVSPNWQKNNFVLEEIGLPRAVNSSRVWKKRV